MADGHHHQTDVVVVGAGPVGLFTVFECGMVRLHCHVVDVLDDVGGQCTALYPEKPIYDIPGFPKVDAAELVVRLKAQAAPFKPAYHLGEQVQSLEKQTGGFWKLTTSKGTVIQAHAVIVAAGVGAFGPNRPPLDGLSAFEGKSVFYYVTQRETFRGKRVVIAGGGDSAVDWALSLSEIAGHVSVIHRRDKFRAAPESEARL
jgi:thioredoxin reductase (NADPH)